MNKFLGLILAAIIGLGLGLPDADAARRLGGGSNVGKQREMQPAPKCSMRFTPSLLPSGWVWINKPQHALPCSESS